MKDDPSSKSMLATVSMVLDEILTDTRTRYVALQDMTQRRMDHHFTVCAQRTVHLGVVLEFAYSLTHLFHLYCRCSFVPC